ncbi:MAG: PHP domain-containing protein [Oscillospiraceae bacterium]
MAKIDLHIHSHCSDDGELSSEELLRLGKQAGLNYMAITDHNTVRGVSAVLASARQVGIEAISGVELDCVHMGRNFHLLGYDFDYTLPVFAEIEQSIIRQEQAAAEEKIARIQRAIGVPLSAEEVLAAADGHIVTGELIAELLLQKEEAQLCPALLPYLAGGARSDNPYLNFYWDYFSQGKPAYVPIHYISLSEGVALLHEAGGIAVLAHPGQNLQSDYNFLERMLEISGIDGIEAYSSYHGRIEAAMFDIVAQSHKLLVTCGSDFHGKIKPSIPLCGHRADENMPLIIDALKNWGILKTTCA